ncbi:hypothetical protein Sta7437_4170 [Stanieria cyanosphaera PCC 7437]|uniref:DOT1 domain-containing protein n=1 Tax=Stanieria cyanosphaera (strain ATCC 29371 / PCC 7437) TaxID=111780 RepID=K9Y126_STAC7|nr:hypothetical protein [Stanieria cyanosphaera]AFZ37647.1 hypothetical protein Sta7437_4170 [Stanieria cyanosphaera PCC 7437]
MIFSNQKNLHNPASIKRKIYLFVSERTFPELIKEILNNGFPLFRRLVGLYFDKKFDRKYNVDTCGSIHLQELTIDSNNVKSGTIYDPIPIKTLKTLFSYLPYNLSEYNFIDFGSGKGRALLVASDYPFRKIIGVEFAHELHQVALSNLEQYNNPKQKCFDIESICVDAVNFPIPQGKCLFFFFAPFGSDIFSKVIENIQKSYTDSPRNMLILYVTDPITDPLPVDEIRSCSLFEKINGGYLPLDLAQRYTLYYELYQAN